MINITTLPKVGRVYIDLDYGEGFSMTHKEAEKLYFLLGGALQELDYAKFNIDPESIERDYYGRRKEL